VQQEDGEHNIMSHWGWNDRGI